MAQQRPLKRDATKGNVAETLSTDTVYGAAAPSSGSDLTNKTYADGHLGGGALDTTNIGVAGKIPIAQGDGSVSFQDPLVQGVYPPGTNTSTGGIAGGAINPILIGGSDYAGTPLLHDIKVDTSGNIYVANGGTFAVQATLAAETTKVIGTTRIIGNAGATLDATLAAGTAPTNGLGILTVYNVTAPAPTNGQSMSLQADPAGNVLTFPGTQFTTGTAWTTATALNTLQYPTGTSTQGQLNGEVAVLVQMDISNSTFTAGQVTFQGSYDNTNWVTIPQTQMLNPNSFALFGANPYTFVTNSNVPVLILTQGYVAIRAKLTTAITGSSSPTVTLYWSTLGTGMAQANTPILPGTPTTTRYSTAAINFSSSGSNTVIAGVSGQTIRVYKIQFSLNGATNIYFLDSTPTSFSGAYVSTGNGSSYSDSFLGEPLFVTASGKGFQINSSSAVSVQGQVWYTQS